MIKSISLLKNYGVYKNFKWGSEAGLPDFKERNVLYGWNYSGKTTISRVFQCLEKHSFHDDYSDGKFKIELHTSQTITESDYSKQDFLVRVFNCDYVSENLKWDEENGIDPIQFDVGGGVNLRDQLKEIHSKKERSQSLLYKINEQENSVDRFENTYTKVSKQIKLDVFNSLIEFSKSHMKKIAQEVENNINSYLLSPEDYKRHHSSSLEVNDKDRIDEIAQEGIENVKLLTDLHDMVSDTLKFEPSFDNPIPELDSDKNAYYWAKKGLDLHEDSFSDCIFCSQPLPSGRLDELKKYFSNEASKLKSKINELKELLKTRSKQFHNLPLPRSKNDLVSSCQARYQNSVHALESHKKMFLQAVQRLHEELDRKEHDLFNSLEINHFDFSFESGVKDSLKQIKELIQEHNSFVRSFEERQGESREILKKHLVAKYLKDEGYIELKKIQSRAIKNKKIVEKINNNLDITEREIEGQLKNVAAGRDELNSFIKLVLSRDDISIEVTGEDRFVLRRGGYPAKNLSEGEKTAISFSYFLVSLESLHREGKLKNTVVFIDDPISSLDSNHISHMYSLINSFFFRQGLEPDNPTKFINCFKQLFISTHNFNFFSFLKDSNRLNKKTKNEPLKKCEYFFVRRLSDTTSTIRPLPKSLRKKSEYLHLFETIYNFYQSGCDLDQADYILLPNAIRRFLELYTLIKLPGTKEEIDGRLNILLGGVHQLKVLHHFSHFSSIDKVASHDDLLPNLETAVKELIKLLEKDEDHYRSLCEAVAS